MTEPAPAAARLVGVYDANGSIPGEIAYWVGARLGTRHCALCEITHGVFRKKSEWTQCENAMPIEFDLLHRNEMTQKMRDACGGDLPCVLSEGPEGEFQLALGPEELSSCGGEPKRLAEKLGLPTGRRQ